MYRTVRDRVLACVLLAGLLSGCRHTPKPTGEEKQAGWTPVVLEYVDTDGFDALLETALRNQDAAIVVKTGFERPEWGARLNAWLAAWNRGGRSRERKVRGQAPLPRVVIDGDSLREFRLLVNSLLDCAEDTARAGSSWYAQERERSRRIALLRPYNLRFHRDEDETIHLIFFHGKFADDYPRFVQELTRSGKGGEWARTVECSECSEIRKVKSEK